MKNCVYVMYSNDKYKLPLFVADNLKELSQNTGVSVNSITSTISHSKKRGRECRFVKVDISEV